jgi:hypothetical protein
MIEKSDKNEYWIPIYGRYISNNPLMSNILTIDNNLNVLSEDSLPNEPMIFNNIKLIDESSFVITGLRYIPFQPYDNDHIIVERLDTAFKVINSYELGPLQVDSITYPGYWKNLDFIDTNNIFVAGTVNFQVSPNPFQQTTSYIILAKFDSHLNLQWQKFYGFDAYYELYSILPTTDNGCFLLASKYDHLTQNAERDVICYKVDSEGMIYNNSIESPIVRPAIIYPNPGNNYLMVQIDNRFLGAVFRIYSIYGNQIISYSLDEPHQTLMTDKLKTGCYYWQIDFDNKVIEKGKWIKSELFTKH